MKNFIKTINAYPSTLLFCLGCLSALAMAPAYLWFLLVIGYSFLLLKLSQSNTHKQSALFGFSFFFGYFLVGLYWVSSSLFVDISRWWWALPFSFMGLPFLLSLFPTILCFLASFLLKIYRIFGFIIAIILSDITRGNLLTGFPWNLPIHGFIEIKYLMNLLPNIGFYALNSMIILLSFLPAFLWLNKSNKKALFCILLSTLITLGFIILSKPLTTIKPKIETPIIMIQANISQHEKWQPESIERNFNRYLDMTSEAIKSDSSYIIIWPETAISQYLLAVPQFNKRFKNFLASLPEQSILMTGFLNYAYDRHYNSLAVFDKTGEIIKMYDKHHLVPFGEYMPFGLDTITGFSNFYSGEKPVPIRIDTLDFNFLPLICYESIFQKYSYQAAKADFLINITNDSWFGNTAGPYQHFDHMILRAIETQKPALRLSGNGLSGYIHTDGNVSHKTFLNEKTSIIID